jgi:pyruvate,orthophosphate dikinase
MHEINPMMGLRGCRLSIVFPQIVEMQTRAIWKAPPSSSRRAARPCPRS